MIRTNNKSAIAVCPATADQYKKAQKLATELAIPLTLMESEEFQFVLLCSAGGLSLKQTGKKVPGPVTVNFTDSTMVYRLQHGGGRTQALARAIGLKKGWHPSVIDATAGLGRDGFVLAYLGCTVHMLERSPILAAMLEDGLKRSLQATQTAEAAGRIQFTRTDSKKFLKKLKRQFRPDVIYLDPMFPERAKSTLVKKELRMLRRLAGDDKDAAELLGIALHCARNRVVVKRPRLAPALGDTAPSHTITGKTSRFDVYLV